GRRERVAVELNTGGIRITFNGIAQSEGSVGQTIDVQNAKTGERFTATVVARGKVVAGPRITEAKED
ncbi:MAG: flagella basal body P-ring formation protein FlgA, partial [Phycisphaeraceae bacterium]